MLSRFSDSKTTYYLENLEKTIKIKKKIYSKSVCMYTHVCACMFMSVQVYLCTCACEDQRAALSAVPQKFFILLLETGPHTDLPTQFQDLFISLVSIECDTHRLYMGSVVKSL